MKKTQETGSGIYKITNLVNGRVYIGQTGNFSQRSQKHITHLTYGSHVNRELQKDWDLYGSDSFVFEIEARQEDFKYYLHESDFTPKYPNLYNQKPGRKAQQKAEAQAA